MISSKFLNILECSIYPSVLELQKLFNDNDKAELLDRESTELEKLKFQKEKDVFLLELQGYLQEIANTNNMAIVKSVQKLIQLTQGQIQLTRDKIEILNNYQNKTFIIRKETKENALEVINELYNKFFNIKIKISTNELKSIDKVNNFKKFIEEKEVEQQNLDLLLKSTKRKDWKISSENKLYKLNFEIKMIEEFIDKIELVIVTKPLEIFNLNLEEFRLFLKSKQEEEQDRFKELLQHYNLEGLPERKFIIPSFLPNSHFSNMTLQERERIINNNTMTHKDFIFSSNKIIEIISFYTWWNKNIATAIIKNKDVYSVFLILKDKFADHHHPVVHSPIHISVYPADRNCKWWGEKPRNIHNSLELAQEEAEWLRTELTKENGRYWNNPILLIHPECDIKAKFTDVCCYPYVIKEQINLPIDISNLELDKHFQIGDIIEVERQRFEGIVQYYHAGIYLGDGMICEMLFNKEDDDEDNKIKITGIRLNKKFREKFRENNEEHKLFRVHPIIPFKHISLIIKQTINSERVLWENNYHLGRRNCQHHAYSIILGINYSWGIWEKRNFFSNGYEKIAKGKTPLRTLVPHLSETYLTVLDTIDTLSDIFNKSCSSNLDNIAELSLNINNGKGEIIVLIKELEETNVLLDIDNNANKQLIEDIEQKYYEQIASPRQDWLLFNNKINYSIIE